MLKIGIICGGKSGEHEVSLLSAYYVYKNLDYHHYQPVILGIDKEGYWHFAKKYEDLIKNRKPMPRMKANTDVVVLIKDHTKTVIFNLNKKKKVANVDVTFPLIHGTYGEDGCLQGYLELLDVPYVGADVIGSAIGMNKEITKRLLMAEKIPVAEFIIIEKKDKLAEKKNKISQAIKKFHFPLFIKPVCLGSSVGVSKVFSRKKINKAVQEAFQYDTKIMIEKFIKGREIECSVLGNFNSKASLPGEIRSRSFYSYKAKYLDPKEKEAKLLAPAPLPEKLIKKIQELSVRVFQTLKLQGMARIDFFLKPSGELVVNEANTIPGFTQISMYPKLWQVSGLSYPRLLNKLIQLAIKSYKEKKQLKRTYH